MKTIFAPSIMRSSFFFLPGIASWRSCSRPFCFENVQHQIYDENWTLREASAAQVTPRVEVPRPPEWLFKALEQLCRPIDHVRVDFMVSGERYYFSEFTFTHNGRNGPGFIANFDFSTGPALAALNYVPPP